MRSDAARAALQDIAYHIELVGEFTKDFDFQAFCSDLRTLYAVTRCLESI